jgi:hypothetical protein
VGVVVVVVVVAVVVDVSVPVVVEVDALNIKPRATHANARQESKEEEGTPKQQQREIRPINTR